MKKTAIPIMAILISLGACRNNDISASKVPSVVKNAVESNYSPARIEWEKNNEEYIAEIEDDSTETEIRINASGSIMATKTDIRVADLPATIINKLKTDYPESVIKEADMVKGSNSISYHIELKPKGGARKYIVVSESGEMLNEPYWKD